MPVDLAMFLSHTGANLFDYSPFVDDRFSFTTDYEDDNFIRSFSYSKDHFLIPDVPKRTPYYGKKKTFDHFKNDAKTEYSEKAYHFSDSGRKKKVSFADDKGFSLVEIREIPGLHTWPLNSPAQASNGDRAVAIPQKSWKVAFQHPPYADSKLVELLEINKVALESVKIMKKTDYMTHPYNSNIVKGTSSISNVEDVLEGTIKVKNLAYEKNVFVRFSFDRWLSSIDVKASYLQPENSSQKHAIYDTFTFHTKIPASSLKYEVIEFCVGYYCNTGEYWDNNGGVNYRLVTEVVNKSSVMVNRSPGKNICDDRITLSLTTNLEKFCEIDSWNCFMLNQPYW